MKQRAVDYFKSDAGYQRLFEEMIQKVKRLGRISGEVKLTALSDVECDAIGSIMRCAVPNTAFKVRLKDFEAMLQKSVFGSLSLKELLDEYEGNEIVSNKDVREHKRSARDDFFYGLVRRFDDTNVRTILDNLPRSFLRLYEEKGLDATPDFLAIFSALSSIPIEGYERLPVFAERITGDPHTFDQDRLGRLLTDGLKVLFDLADTSSLEEVAELYAAAGLLKDDVNNFVSISGLQASNFTYWALAQSEGAVLNVPLREILKVKSVVPMSGRSVFVVENSGVFSAILDHFPNSMPPLVCLHGQPKLSSIALLEKLVDGGTTLYYSGDFDPEGILICERLWRRFGDHLIPWRMGKADYEACGTTVALSSRRLSMLKNIQHHKLADVKEQMLESSKAGYQEGLLSQLIRDMKSMIHGYCD